MKPKNLQEIQASFSIQSLGFENDRMPFSRQDYLDYTVQSMRLTKEHCVLETAAGTCACGRSIAPFVKSVACLDATPAMLAIGEEEARHRGLTNMRFINGYVEALPFHDQCFDTVLNRLAFHHFTEMEKPFYEMHRVLKRGGQLVIIDMEAAEDALRDVKDRLETMRDPSHVRNRSRHELLGLYEEAGYTMLKQEATPIPVALSAWLALPNTPKSVREEIERMLREDLHGGPPTGFQPYIHKNEIYIRQRWVLLIGEKA